MATMNLGKKTVSLNMEEALYTFLEAQARENGEDLNSLIHRMLMDSMESWCDYCDTVRTLSDDTEERFHICVKPV